MNGWALASPPCCQVGRGSGWVEQVRQGCSRPQVQALSGAPPRADARYLQQGGSHRRAHWRWSIPCPCSAPSHPFISLLCLPPPPQNTAVLGSPLYRWVLGVRVVPLWGPAGAWEGPGWWGLVLVWAVLGSAPEERRCRGIQVPAPAGVEECDGDSGGKVPGLPCPPPRATC